MINLIEFIVMSKQIFHGLFFLALLAISAKSNAAPIYLNCKTNGPDSIKFEVALDESSSSINHTFSDGAGFSTRGIFSAKKISYKRFLSFGDMNLKSQFEINRTNLQIKITSISEASDPDIAKSVKPVIIDQNGFCEVEKTVKRKI